MAKRKKRKQSSTGVVIAVTFLVLCVSAFAFAAISRLVDDSSDSSSSTTTTSTAPQVDAGLADYKASGKAVLNSYYASTIPDTLMKRLTDGHQAEVRELADIGIALVDGASCRADVDAAVNNTKADVSELFDRYFYNDIVILGVRSFDEYYIALLDEFPLYDDSPEKVNAQYLLMRKELLDKDLSEYKQNDGIVEEYMSSLCAVFEAEPNCPAWTPIS